MSSTNYDLYGSVNKRLTHTGVLKDSKYFLAKQLYLSALECTGVPNN